MPRASDFVPPLLTRAFKRSVRRDDPVVRRDGLFGDFPDLSRLIIQKLLKLLCVHS